jgi:hypothetical protein
MKIIRTLKMVDGAKKTVKKKDDRFAEHKAIIETLNDAKSQMFSIAGKIGAKEEDNKMLEKLSQAQIFVSKAIGALK